MVDREKVIKGLGLCIDEHKDCNNCCYHNVGIFCVDVLMRDALELLKEQEPIIIHKYEFDEIYNYIAVCPECEMEWAMWKPDRMRYCPGCGKAVKWDG